MSTAAKPYLRGVSHEVAFFIALVAGGWLVATAASRLAIAVTAIYVITLALMLGVSASYHRGNRSPIAELRWKRADHAMIFVFVAEFFPEIGIVYVADEAALTCLVIYLRADGW